MPTKNIKNAYLCMDQFKKILWKCSSCNNYVEHRLNTCNWCNFEGELKYISKEDFIESKKH